MGRPLGRRPPVLPPSMAVPAEPGETCSYHPRCCPPGRRDGCPGCGEPAVTAVEFVTIAAIVRVAFCGLHGDVVDGDLTG